jgi:transglutaminase-like putative cysteine protease
MASSPDDFPLGRPTRYRVEHETRYGYAAPVSQSWQLARLTPRSLPWQRPLHTRIEVSPVPEERRDSTDGFGNTITHFSLYGPHRVLKVRMQCGVDVGPRPVPVASLDGPWEDVCQAVRGRGEPLSEECLSAAALTEPTRLLPSSEAARLYAEPSLVPGRPWLDALLDLMHRIHAEFEFDPEATTVSTSVDEVLEQRRGVCQDFAHLMLACLRAHGLPARYVSGYLLTDPPPGQPRLMGVDASHAWVAAFSPQHGWVEFDPTNDQLADQRYITLAWGADFADVVPLRGVIIGSGEQSLRVSVSVIPE